MHDQSPTHSHMEDAVSTVNSLVTMEILSFENEPANFEEYTRQVKEKNGKDV